MSKQKFVLFGNFTGPRYNQKAVDDWAKRIPPEDRLESTYSSLLLTVLIVAVILCGGIIALVVFGE